MILVNGYESERISVFDRGFQYGDGLFETIEVLYGQPVFLEEHIARLRAGCSRLRIPFVDESSLLNEVTRLCTHTQKGVLKITVTRGIGGRGYRQPERIEPSRIVSLLPFPDYPPSFHTQGIAARVCSTRLGLNPALAGMKHLNRLDQILARAEWESDDYQEGIMLDMRGLVIEGTMTNLFYRRGHTIYTATLDFSGVAGIVRAVVMRLFGIHRIAVVEHDYNLETLLLADEIFVCNSLLGICPVRQIDSNSFEVGELTQRLQAWYLNYKEERYGKIL